MPNHSVLHLFTVISFFLLTLLPQNVAGQVDCQNTDIPIDIRPNHTGPPTEITLGVLVIDITGVDDAAQAISGDFLLELQWEDKRLVEQAGCRIPIAKVWEPRIQLFNSHKLSTKRNFQKDQVEVETGGHIHYYQRYIGSISTYHHLAQFPFDSHNFQIRIGSTDYNTDEITIKADKEFTRVADLINIPDWIIGNVQATVETMGMAELRSPRSIFIMEIPAVRNSNFYIWKILVPLVLIVFMSWAVFWINPVKFGPQLGLSATSMLTLIAFQFAQTGVLPRLSYFTVMDKLILGSSILVFLSFFEAVGAIYLVSKGAEKTAVKMDKICRWLFPVMFTIYWASVMLRL